MNISQSISSLTSKFTTSMKKKQLLTAFLDKYTLLLNKICDKLDNEINIATIVTIVNSLKKRNPKLIVDLWYTNVAIKFVEMKITRENFVEKAESFVKVIQGDSYFSDSVRDSTQNLFAKFNEYVNADNPLTPELFNDFETVVKLSIMYHTTD